MLKKLLTFIENLLCKHGFHKMRWDSPDKNGVIPGSHCVRTGCTKKIGQTIQTREGK